MLFGQTSIWASSLDPPKAVDLQPGPENTEKVLSSKASKLNAVVKLAKWWIGNCFYIGPIFME